MFLVCALSGPQAPRLKGLEKRCPGCFDGFGQNRSSFQSRGRGRILCCTLFTRLRSRAIMASAPGDTRCREVQVHGKWFAVVGMALILTVGTLPAAGPQKDGIETEDLKLAEEAVVVSMAVSSAELHGNQGLEGPGPNPFDLGMAVIGARNTPTSLRALAGLVRFRFDGAYSEDYDSYVMAKGKSFKRVLRSLNPEQLHEQCLHEFANLQKDKSYAKAIQGAREDDVCETAGTIKERVKEFVSSLSRPPSHER